MEIKTRNIHNNFWSVSSGFGSGVNYDGRIYIGSEATLFRLVIPGLSGDAESVSFQLYGHPRVFVRRRSGGEIYVDRNDETLEFCKYSYRGRRGGGGAVRFVPSSYRPLLPGANVFVSLGRHPTMLIAPTIEMKTIQLKNILLCIGINMVEDTVSCRAPPPPVYKIFREGGNCFCSGKLLSGSES